MELKELQEELNNAKYPPTQVYEIDGLKPDNFLRDRLDIINSICPEFFQGECFLDVGISKGFFSFLAAKKCFRVVGIEPPMGDISHYNLCVKIRDYLHLNNVEIYNTNFKDFHPNILFDRVFLGNVMHYLYHPRESKEKIGWSFIYKLAAMVKTDGIVIIESPLDCNVNLDIRYMGEDDYTKERFLEVIEPFFEVIGIKPSRSLYRSVVCLKRKLNPLDNIFEYEHLYKTKIFDNRSNREIFLCQYGVCKIFDYVPSMEYIIKVCAISYSDLRPNLYGLVRKNGVIIGFMQEFIENEFIIRDVWENYKKDRKMLLDIGYKDADPALSNVFLKEGKFKFIDFSAIGSSNNVHENSKICFKRTVKRDYYFNIGETECNNEIKKFEDEK